MQAVATTKFMFPDGVNWIVISSYTVEVQPIILRAGVYGILKIRARRRQASFPCFLKLLQASLFQDDPLTAPCVLPLLNPAN
jgi:hypothetical protein